jgi:hypothetical protein
MLSFLLGVLIVAVIATGIIMAFKALSKREKGGPPNQPQKPGHVGSRESV